MKKDRFVAFFDAIMAIIMTIVVLEFVIPDGTKWSDLSNLGYQVLVYALSFFWLGGMWIGIHNLWHDVDIIDRGVLWVNLAMLFFASMIPFLVVYAGRNLTEAVPQILYGADALVITVLNGLSAELLAKHHDCVKALLPSFRKSVIADFAIKAVGVVIGATVFPLAIMISVLVAMILMIVLRTIAGKRHEAKGSVSEEKES